MTEEEKKESKNELITEICMAGACNRGVCYIGAFKKLEELKLLKLEKIVGVSIGAFISVCYILGYTSNELLRIIIEKDMKELKDISLTEQGAVLKGEQYKNWVFEVLSKKVDPYITLIDLYSKTKINFITTTTCIHSTIDEFKEGIVYMSHIHTPNMPLITAINCSMAFPFIFPPINYKGCQFIDGGLLDNFPLELVSEKALGLKVNFKPIDGSTSTKNPISYIGKLFELISNRFKYLKSETHKNVICIDCDDFNLIDFEMSIDDKITLYKRGYTAIEKFVNQSSSSSIETTLDSTE